jgi:tetratricopeptide (TPR) repeat protein
MDRFRGGIPPGPGHGRSRPPQRRGATGRRATSLKRPWLQRTLPTTSARSVSALWLRATAGEGFDEVRALTWEAVAHFRQIGATRRIYPLLNTAAFAAIEYERYSEALPLLDEALPAARAADDGPGIAMIRGNEAVAHLMVTNYEEAADALSEQLRLCRDLSLDQTVEEALLCTATIAAHRGERHDAGLLAGAASTRFDKRRRMPAEELLFRRIRDQLLRAARETDPQSWDSAARAGGALRERDAVELALRALNDPPDQAAAIATDRTRAH